MIYKYYVYIHQYAIFIMKQLHLDFITDEEFDSLVKASIFREKRQKRLEQMYSEIDEFRLFVRAGWEILERVDDEDRFVGWTFNDSLGRELTDEELLVVLGGLACQNKNGRLKEFLSSKQLFAFGAIRFWYLCSISGDIDLMDSSDTNLYFPRYLYEDLVGLPYITPLN